MTALRLMMVSTLMLAVSVLLAQPSSSIQQQVAAYDPEADNIVRLLDLIATLDDFSEQEALLLSLSRHHSSGLGSASFVATYVSPVDPSLHRIWIATLLGDFYDIVAQKYTRATEAYRSAFDDRSYTLAAQEVQEYIAMRLANNAQRIHALELANQAASYCIRDIKPTNLYWRARCLSCLIDLSESYYSDTLQANRYRDQMLVAYRRLLDQNRQDTTMQLLALYRLAELNNDTSRSPRVSLLYVKRGLRLLATSPDPDFQAHMVYQQGLAYLNLGDYKNGNFLLQQAADQFTQTQDTARLIEVYTCLGRLNFQRSLLTLAAQYYTQALSAAEAVEEYNNYSFLHRRLYDVYVRQKNYPKAVWHLEQHDYWDDELSRQVRVREMQMLKRELNLSNERAATQFQELRAEAAERDLVILIVTTLCIILASLLAIWMWLRSYQANQELREKNALILQQREQLSELDKAKTRFFSNLTHEFATPLTMILGPLSNLLKSKTLSEEINRELTTVKQNAQQLSKLVRELLDLTRIENARVINEPSPVDITQLLEQNLVRYRGSTPPRNLTVVYDSELTADSPTLLLDAQKLDHIIDNLLSNAYKYSQPHSSIHLVVRLLAGEHLEINVSDQGSGIPSQDIPFIFDRFYQARNSRHGGTGIGLAICYEMVKIMGGTINVHSKLGHGSTFTVVVPCQRVAQSLPPALSHTPPAGAQPSVAAADPAQETILLVEDNPDIITFVESLLSPTYRVITAQNGHQAMTQLIHQPAGSIDLVITDIGMPVMDGAALVEWIKEDSPFPNLPVVVLTAYTDPRLRLDLLRAGVDDYLRKPFLPEELLVRVSNILLRRRSILATTPALVQTEPAGEAMDEPDGSYSSVWLGELERVVTSHLNDPQFSVEFIAQQMAISERTLYRVVKQMTGLTPNDYVKEVRLCTARDLLTHHSGMLIKDVARQVGFGSASHFSRLYKERFGINPSEHG